MFPLIKHYGILEEKSGHSDYQELKFPMTAFWTLRFKTSDVSSLTASELTKNKIKEKNPTDFFSHPFPIIKDYQFYSLAFVGYKSHKSVLQKHVLKW